MEQIVGTVGELWRYPMKSMLGEQVMATTISNRGLWGDRAWALRDRRSGNLVSAKKWPRMLAMRAYYETPIDQAAPKVRIDLPGRPYIYADAPDAGAILSEFLGFAVSVDRAGGDERAEIEIDPASIFGDIPVHEIFKGLAAGTALPPTFGTPRGTFFDAAPLHVIAAPTLAHLGQLTGRTSAEVRRFRPNLLLETIGDGFVEDQWLGATLAIGTVVIHRLQPTLRCVMITLAQQELARDGAILRAAAQHHGAFVGVTGEISGEGTVQVGDSVRLVR